mmetsp:Transcript_49246/g.76895  ORF Transcript_49246/g.76895 Transcript_49246/m.76895 type:complete len:497 (-) Transcript_49246:493-1983(-)
MSAQEDFVSVRRSLHEAAFGLLRSGVRDPWDLTDNQESVRSLVSNSVNGYGSSQLPDFAARLNLPSEAELKPKLKLILKTEKAYDKYVEILDMAEGVRSREGKAESLRKRLNGRRQGASKLTVHRLVPCELPLVLNIHGWQLADQIFDLEIEELELRREILRRDSGEEYPQLAPKDDDETLALYAATSLQPVLRVVIQTALKRREAERETGAAVNVVESITKKLEKASTDREHRDSELFKEGLLKLKDRSKALVSLVENISNELREVIDQVETSIVQEKLEDKKAVVAGLRYLYKFADKDVEQPACTLQAAARRAFIRDHYIEMWWDHRMELAATCLQGFVFALPPRGSTLDGKPVFGYLEAARVLRACGPRRVLQRLFRSKRRSVTVLQAVTRRTLTPAPREEDSDDESDDGSPLASVMARARVPPPVPSAAAIPAPEEQTQSLDTAKETVSGAMGALEELGVLLAKETDQRATVEAVEASHKKAAEALDRYGYG